MKRLSTQNLEHIKNRFEQETDICLGNATTRTKHTVNFANKRNKLAWVASLALFLLTFSAFGFAKFSSLAGDDVGFETEYMGNGVIKIFVSNYSDRILKLDEQVKLSRWSTSEEVGGDITKIVYSDMLIEPKTKKEITIDLSEAYDMQTLENALPENDWYYLTLTNNNFVFGQDWMCGVDFHKIEASIEYENDETTVEPVVSLTDRIQKDTNTRPFYSASLAYEDWAWPTVSESITTRFGNPKGLTMTDHINIKGEKGDAVYAVSDATVLETGFDATYGYYIILDLSDGLTVKYGHLGETLVENKDKVSKGQQIAKVGSTGMATGPNLAFFVYQNGEPVNPLDAEDDM